MVFSPVLELQPGIDGPGTVREYWVASGATPDGGPAQIKLWLLFAPIETIGHWPDDFATLPTDAFPPDALCNQDDAACNAKYDGAYQDFSLIVSIAPGQDAIQLGLISHFL